MQVYSPRDAGRFADLVEDQVTLHPRDPLVIAISGHQIWLTDILRSCIEDYQTDIPELNREVQFAGTAKLPEKASKRTKRVPWTFIMDQMNVPQVYPWSVDLTPPHVEHDGLPHMERYRFRVGVWRCGSGACKVEPSVPVTLIFTQPLEVPELVVTNLLFTYLQADGDYQQPYQGEEGICWIFLRLYWLFTDWQNIIRECSLRLKEAEASSHERKMPLRLRTRILHEEIARMHELQRFLNFHHRSFKKLLKLQGGAFQHDRSDDPLWLDMVDAADDLEQFDYTITSLKDLFNNLIELEFNLENACQSDNTRFLLIVATLFLPLSFLASIFGISTIEWPAIWFLWIAMPIFAFSACLTAIMPFAVIRLQKRLFPIEKRHVSLSPGEFTMLGDELPDGVDIPGNQRLRRARPKAPDPALTRNVDSRDRPKRVRYEKDG
ncbi:hypothetical protein MBLNU230_g1846t1 [Neophaeotheca triangularis]